MAVTNGQVIRVDAQGDFDGTEDIVNVYQFQMQSGGPVNENDVLGDMLVILTALTNLIKALHTATTVWRRIRAQNISNGILLGVLPFAAPIAGTASGDSGAPGVAGLISLPSAVPRVVPRKYFGPLSESNLGATGLLAAGTLTTLTSIATILTNDQTTSSHTYRYGYLSPKTGTFVIPSAAVITSVPAYQRRRRQGRGS